MANITSVNELWGRKWRFKDNTPSPSEFSLRNSVTGVKFATFYLGEQVKEVYQTGSNVGNVGITTQGTFIRIGVSESSFTYAYAASGWVGKPAILEFVENTNNYTLSCTNESNFISWFNENASEYIPPLNEWTKEVSNAIRNKSGKSDPIKPLNWAKEINNLGSGGFEINGLIEEYKVFAGETINAGDFVDFVTNTYKQLNSTAYNYYSAPYCILLNNNKVFIAHRYGNNYLYGTIVEFNDIEMTTTTFVINNTITGGYGCKCLLLEENKILIVEQISYLLYGTIVEINGTTPTITTTQLTSEDYSCNCNVVKGVLLEKNKVFVVYGSTNSNYLYGAILKINGTEITITTTQLNSSSDTADYIDCILLENNKVFIAHNYGSSYTYGTIVEINETTMTATSTRLNTNNCNTVPSCVLLEDNKVFIAHSYGSSYYLYGTIVNINGTTMTATTTQLNSTSKSCYRGPSCVLLEDNKVFIAHSYGSSYYLYGTIVNINGTTMTATSTRLNSSTNSSVVETSCVLLEDNKVFIAHSYGSSHYLYGTIFFVKERIKQPTATTIKGVAKTSGTEGQTIQVYVPNNE